MSFLKWLFGKSKQMKDEGPGLEQQLEYLNSLTLPAIGLLVAGDAGFSRIGGLPSLPDDIAWPEWNGKPLAFLCQIDLAEIPKDCERNGLPESGALYFFYNQEQGTWGFDPKDEGSWRVIYSSTAPSNGARRAAPKGLVKDCVYTEKSVGFTPVMTYPDILDERVEALGLSQKQADAYCDLSDSVFKGNDKHHLLGHPDVIQSPEMDLECQLASNGIYVGDPAGYKDPRAKELEAGRNDWILLLQLDSDDDANMMWGDGGMLYFWIRKQDLAERRFDKCWMILQCY